MTGIQGPSMGEGVQPYRGVGEGQQISPITFGQQMSAEVREEEKNSTKGNLSKLVGTNRDEFECPVRVEQDFQSVALIQSVRDIELKGIRQEPEPATGGVVARLARRILNPMRGKKSMDRDSDVTKQKLMDRYSDVVNQINNIDTTRKTFEISNRIGMLRDQLVADVVNGVKIEPKFRDEINTLVVEREKILDQLMDQEHALMEEMDKLMVNVEKHYYPFLQEMVKGRLQVEGKWFEKKADALWEKRIQLHEGLWAAESKGEHKEVAEIEKQINTFDRTLPQVLTGFKEQILERNQTLFDKLKKAASLPTEQEKTLRKMQIENQSLDDQIPLKKEIIRDQWKQQRRHDAWIPGLFSYQRQLETDQKMVKVAIDSNFVEKGLDKLVDLLRQEGQNSDRKISERLPFRHLHGRLHQQMVEKQAAIKATIDQPDRHKAVLEDPVVLFLTDAEKTLLTETFEKID